MSLLYVKKKRYKCSINAFYIYRHFIFCMINLLLQDKESKRHRDKDKDKDKEKERSSKKEKEKEEK